MIADSYKKYGLRENLSLAEVVKAAVDEGVMDDLFGTIYDEAEGIIAQLPDEIDGEVQRENTDHVADLLWKELARKLQKEHLQK